MTDDRHDADDALTDDDRAQLARWQPDGAPAGFADRVLAAHVAPAPVRPPMRIRYALGAVGLAGAAAIVVIAARPAPTSLAVSAAPLRTRDARETVRIGARAVAVAEPGSALAFLASGPDAHIEQPSGGVFYRVEPGGRFDVVTPVGTIEVTGTCFRVEVHPMNKQAILSGALSAVVATAAVVTVYEGKIRVVRGGTAPVEVQAGQRATLTPGAVAVNDTPGGPAAAPPAPVVDDPTIASLSHDQLIARDRAQREQLAALGARVQQLESNAGKDPPHGGGLEGDWMNPTKDQLAEWAKDCTIKIDFPQLESAKPMQLEPGIAKDVHLSGAEVATVNATLAKSRTDWENRVRGWYVEATGDVAGADSLSTHAMGQELQDKADPGEPSALQQRLAQERAGLAAPPADQSKLSPYERYFRAFVELGSQTERELAGVIGPDKAHQIRAHDGGWPQRMAMSGCRDGEGEPPE